MLARLTAAALLVGLIAAASYAVGATAVFRIVKPALGGVALIAIVIAARADRKSVV